MIRELTSLRIVLMLMIFIHHINNAYNGGYSAVAGFFVLGGFVMTLGYKKKIESSEFSYSSYLTKRLLRIYPMHWICLAIMLLITLLNGEELMSSIKVLALNFLLLQSWVPIIEVFFSYNSLSWYCSSLILFIIFFPLFIKNIVNITNKNKILLWSAITGVYILMWVLFPKGLRHPVLYINPVMRLFDSLVGVGAAILVFDVGKNVKYHTFIIKHDRLLQMVAIFGVIAFVGLSLWLKGVWKSFSLLYWIPIVIICVSLTLLNHIEKETTLSKILTSVPLQWIGRCSFSFYMCHALVIKYLTEYIQRYVPYGNNLYIRAFILCLISFALAQVLYYLVEIKLTKRLNNSLLKTQ